MNRSPWFSLVSAVAVAGAVVVESRDSWGETSCAQTTTAWNAQAGALVLSRSDGIIGRGMAGLETRSHSMLAGYASSGIHSTLDVDYLKANVKAYNPLPGTTDVCDNGPIKGAAMSKPKPGVQVINMGAIYTFYYLSDDSLQVLTKQFPAANPADSNRQQRRAATVAEWMRTQAESASVASRTSGGKQIAGGYRVLKAAGVEQTYKLFQFTNSELREEGHSGTGLACSTSIAWGFYNAARSATDRTPWPSSNLHLSVYDYPVSSYTSLGNGVKSGVEEKCVWGGGSWGTMRNTLSAFACGEPSGLCDDLARQVRNCMAADVCDSDDQSVWDIRTGRFGAHTVSPSRLGGLDQHKQECSGPCPPLYDTRGPWYATATSNVTWSAAGTVYGCWSDDGWN